ncbi:MAG: class I SAM-dependent methyltransferase [Chloroflexi bacterium]|nr:class I SAM-dependent methyltransferase [Chloroflexota bacterium]
MDLLEAKPGSRLLDIGSGGGHLLAHAYGRKIIAYGVDISIEALQRSHRIYQMTNIIQAAAEELPFPNETFDYITCLGSLEHFYDPQSALLEMRSVLKKPQGQACIVVPNLWSFLAVMRGWYHGVGITHRQESERFYSLVEAQSLLTQNGFIIEQVFGYHKPQSCYNEEKSQKAGVLNRLYHLTYRYWRRLLPPTAAYAFVFICRPQCG